MRAKFFDNVFIDENNAGRKKMCQISSKMKSILYSLNDPNFSETIHIEAEELRDLIKVVVLTSS